MRPVLAVVVAVLLVFPRASSAQTVTRGSDESRVFVDVNLSGAANSVANARHFTSLFLRFGEVGSTSASYAKPARANAFSLGDLGGGFMLSRLLGVGASYSRAAYEDAVDLAASIPHPTFVDAKAHATLTGGALTRKEAAVNLFVAFVPIRTSRTHWRFFGGPSFFSYRADMVQDVLYAQAYDALTPLHTITISGVTSKEVANRRTGFHIGTDVTCFFTKTFGVGGGVRFSRGTVTVEDPLSKVSQQIRVGGALAQLGLRVRFGG